MHTAALLLPPEPRRIAGRPVDWMADIIVDGGVVPIVVSMEARREKVVEWMPVKLSKGLMLAEGKGQGARGASLPGSFSSADEISLIHSSHLRGTEKLASYAGSIFFVAGAEEEYM